MIAGGVASADVVFDQFLSLCEGAGPERCALAGGRHTPAERFERLVARLKRAPIPAPGAKPPLSSREKLSYADLLLSQFNPIRAPDLWPQDARDHRRRAGRRRLGAGDRGRRLHHAGRLRRLHDLGGDLSAPTRPRVRGRGPGRR